jgi:ethanolamine ammonia-lyase large subunit
MLSYQSTSFHDALYLRAVLGLRPAPEFEEWLTRMGIGQDYPGIEIPATLSPKLIGLDAGDDLPG